VKSLFSGIAMASVAGLLLGGAMKPDLGYGDRPEGPQLFAGWSGVRGETGPFDDGASWAAYGGQIPDYVVGTDWRTASTWPKDLVAYEPQDPPNYYEKALAERPQHPVARYEDEPREEPVYPSMKGGAAYAEGQARDAAARDQAPPPPPEFDVDAPPEATGDTRPIPG
jgi:hypothetical protein